MLESAPNTATSFSQLNNAASGSVADDRAIRGGSSQSLSAAALLPHRDRCAYADIPELALRGQPSIKPEEVWDTFTKDFAPIENFFCCIQLVRPNRLRLWCPTATILEDVMNTGLTLRGHPLRIKPIIDRCWLTVTHLPYGLPEQAILDFFADFGEVKSVRFVQFRNVFTGTVKVQMVLHKTVPTRIRILGHAGLVYHPGQARTCFHCGTLGHESKRCPAKETSSPTPGEQSSGAKKKKTPKKSRGRSSTTSGPPPGQPSNTPGPSSSVSEECPPGPESPNYEEEFPELGSSNPSPRGEIDHPVDPADTPPQPSDISASGTEPTPSHKEDNTAPSEPSSPKGTSGPTVSEDLIHFDETDTAVPPTDNARPAFGIRFSDPPLVRSDIKSFRNSRKKKPAPIPAGIGLACTRKPSTPAPVCGTGAKQKSNAGEDPSGPPPMASSS